MTTIASLQDELNDLRSKAQAATDDAKKHRTNAANYSANGYADKMESETVEALESDRLSATHRDEAAHVVDRIKELEVQAEGIENQIKDLVKQYKDVTGQDLAMFL